jgi:hypothetical protein
MKLTTITKRIALVLAFALLTTCALPASAVGSQDDASIQTFWSKFKAAVIKGDQASVAAMSQFPITMPYGIPAVRTKGQLLKRYRDVFSVQANAAKCFGEAMPEPDANNKNRFTVTCKDAAGNEVVIYGFIRIRGVWKLRSLDNINE